MREIVDQFNYYKWSVIHHRWLVLLGAILICSIGWMVVQNMPDQYKAETKVYLDTQTVLKSILQGLAVDSQVREHAAKVMQRTLVARPNLERVVKESDLHLRVDNNHDMERMISHLEKAIKISSISLGRRGSSNLYSITYVNEDPKIVKNVIDNLLNIFVETILGTSRKDTARAQDFLDEQIALYESKQRDAEEKLKVFRQKNADIMSESGGGYYSKINALEAKIEETKLLLREVNNRIASLRSQINDLQRPTHSEEPAAVVTGDSSLDIRISNMERRLDELLLQYTDEHVDVISTRRVLEQLKKEKRENRKEMLMNPDKVNTEIMTSPVYQELNVILGEAQAEAAALRARLQEYEQRRIKMNSVLEKIPEIDAELASLNRDYEITKHLYRELVKRRESSQLSYKAEQTGNELQFKIIEPPRMPTSPYSPDRISLITLVLLAGLGGGIGIGILFEMIRPTFYTRQQIEETIGLPILGSVSLFLSNAERKRRYVGVSAYCLVSGFLLSAYLALLVHNGFDINIHKYALSMVGNFL